MTAPGAAARLDLVRKASLSDVWTALRTLLLAPYVEVRLRFVGVRRTANQLGAELRLDGCDGRATSHASVPPRGRLSDADKRRLRVAWRILAIGPFDGTCLRRSLIGAHILRNCDDVAVRIGVRRSKGELRAHAWLEVDGVSLDPLAAVDFAAEWQHVAEIK